MLELYRVIEHGHRTTFLNLQDSSCDVFGLLCTAARSAGDNGGNLTAALAGLQNSSGLHPQARPLWQLDDEEAEEYDQDFHAKQDGAQRITIDVDRGVMTLERSPNAPRHSALQDGEQPIPEETLVLLKQAREAPAVRLKDLVLLGLPPSDVYLVHKRSDVGTISAAGLKELTDGGRAEFADLLSAKVESIQPGAYGMELVVTGILPERLVDFDRAQAAMMRAGPHLGLFQPDCKEPECLKEALQAVRDYLCFERDTTQIWPWFLSAEEMLGDERKLQEIGAALHPDPEHGYDTDEIYQALTEAFGLNPALEQGQGQTMAP